MENATEGKTQKKTRGRPFVKGNAGGPGRGKRKPLPAAGTGIDLLADYERAYTTAETPGDSPMVKALRRRAHDDPGKFAQEYARLKIAAGERVERSDAPEREMGSVGPKEMAVEELAERLLTEWERHDAGSS